MTKGASPDVAAPYRDCKNYQLDIAPSVRRPHYARPGPHSQVISRISFRSGTMATTMTTQATRGRFVWHELMTKDPKAAQDFYTKVVGWTTSKFEGGTDYTMWMAGETPVGGVM